MKYFFLFFGILLVSIIIFIINPVFYSYEACVIGRVLDENNQPIEDAKVIRIEEKITSHPRFGYEVWTPVRTDITFTDENGIFKFNNKKKLTCTFHKKLITYCDLNFEVLKEGYAHYKSLENEWNIDNSYPVCDKTVFKPTINLKKLE